MLKDYTGDMNTGRQIVVGLSRVPEGKCKTPDGNPANCRVDIYKVPDQISSNKNLVYHIEHVGFAGAVLPYGLIEVLNDTNPHSETMNKPLIQIYGSHSDVGTDNCTIRAYKRLVSPKSGESHITYKEELRLKLDNPTEVINQIRAGINSLI